MGKDRLACRFAVLLMHAGHAASLGPKSPSVAKAREEVAEVEVAVVVASIVSQKEGPVKLESAALPMGKRTRNGLSSWDFITPTPRTSSALCTRPKRTLVGSTSGRTTAVKPARSSAEMEHAGV